MTRFQRSEVLGDRYNIGLILARKTGDKEKLWHGFEYVTAI